MVEAIQSYKTKIYIAAKPHHKKLRSNFLLRGESKK